VTNGITTVHQAYVREQAGHALIAAQQWIPREHAPRRDAPTALVPWPRSLTRPFPVSRH
jgi:hypothetical protein